MECRQNLPRPLHPATNKPKRRLPPEVLSDDEICAMMEACGRYAPSGLRNRALIALLYRTGLRINEALSLYPKDLDLTDGCIRVLNGKCGRSRTVGLDPGAAAIIERWLDERLGLGLGGRHPVFCTLGGHPMAAAYVRVMLKRLAARAGIDKRVHAHGLRHTHAAQLRAEGVDIAIISRHSATPLRTTPLVSSLPGARGVWKPTPLWWTPRGDSQFSRESHESTHHVWWFGACRRPISAA